MPVFAAFLDSVSSSVLLSVSAQQRTVSGEEVLVVSMGCLVQFCCNIETCLD